MKNADLSKKEKGNENITPDSVKNQVKDTKKKALSKETSNSISKLSVAIDTEMGSNDNNQFPTKIGIEEILEEVEKTTNNKGLFKVKTANEWIESSKKRPIPKMLFGELWFENELCILFADTNLGKSILAVQIGNSISKGTTIKGFPLEAKKQVILYFDFELSDKQFENRYSINYQEHYLFDKNFIRIEINPDADIPNKISFDEYLNFSLEKSIIETKSKILIIDNLTYLKNETEKSKNALPLMKYLKSLKSKYNLSLLVLAHTPKRDLSKPITRNDLAGSKMLINFADSCFSIGESHSDKNIRYIKQIKSRNTEIVFDSENIAVCKIEKPHNFLAFEFLNFGTEKEHLKELSFKDKEKLEADILELRFQNPTLSFGKIAKQLGTNKMKVKRTIDKTKP